ALARLTDVGWGTELRRRLAEDASDEPVDERMFQGMIRVLADWDWQERPVGVVAMPSLTRPVLITDLAERIARTARLRSVASLQHRTQARVGPRCHNSPLRLHQVYYALPLGEETARSITEVNGPILLVDDYTDTGWSLTVAAALLRRAGAPAVLPLTL